MYIHLKFTLQLTCMYNHVKSEASQNFTDYPADMLLYYKWVTCWRHWGIMKSVLYAAQGKFVSLQR